MTPGSWRVANWLTGKDEPLNGKIVVTARQEVVADCRNDAFSDAEQRSNASAIGYLPDIIATLRLCETYFGDRPARTDREAAKVYARVAICLNVIDGRKP